MIVVASIIFVTVISTIVVHQLQHRYKHHLHHRSRVVLKPYAPLAHLFFAPQLPEPLSRVVSDINRVLGYAITQPEPLSPADG